MKKPMKTATVTWTTYNNYGTILQAYALQQELLKLGHENEILSDKEIIAEQESRNKKSRKKKETAGQLTQEAGSMFRRAVQVLSSPGRMKRALLARLDRESFVRPYYASQQAFERFKKQHLMIRSFSIEMMDELESRYDALIAGSDQIWSVHEDTYNPFFFLDFSANKKVSYAPSLGSGTIPEALKPELQRLLSDYSAISVREELSAKQLSEIIGQDVVWAADPTLLLRREEWESFVRDTIVPVKGPYLLCYFLENQPWYFEQAKILARKLRLRPVLIPNRWDYLSNGYVIDGAVGPKEFVALFRDAECVLTDSYHGSIFSLLFEKKFQYLQRFREDDPGSQNIRIHSLFGYLSCTDRILEKPDRDKEIAPLDPEISRKISAMRRKSLDYLARSL